MLSDMITGSQHINLYNWDNINLAINPSRDQ